MPSHATVVAYLALFVALGGSAYAITRIDSGDVVNDSLKSKDLKDRKAVAGRDLRQDTLTGEQIRESRLDASEFSAFASGGGACDPISTATPCGSASLALDVGSAVLVVVTGGFSSSQPSTNAICEVVVDGNPVANTSVGQDDGSHRGGVTANGFGVSGVSPAVAAGMHEVGLQCREAGGDARITDVNIAAVALGSD